MKTHYNLRTHIKVRICFVIALMAVTQSLPAWDYLTVYRNDGEEPLVLFSADVDSMVCSKIGTDSLLYADWQVQEIWAPDTTYRIPLAAIDSISIKTVDIETAAKNVVEVSKQISRIFVQTETLNELATHLGEIRNMEKVDDAWFNGTSLFVKVNDWGTISFSYHTPSELLPDEENGKSSNKPNQIGRDIYNSSNSHVPISYDPYLVKVCIVNQTYNDIRFNNDKILLERLEKNLSALGFTNERYIFGHYFDEDFINDGIYNYDIILMNTHGEYDGQRHWIYTGREYFSSTDFTDIDEWTADISPWDELYRKLIEEGLQQKNSPNSVSCGFLKEKRKYWYSDEEKDLLVCYAKVSEIAFSKNKKRFRGDGTAIFFNTACQSMQDNHSFALSLIRKGVGYYLGYTHSNTIGLRACEEFTNLLLNSYDVKRAVKLMSSDNKSEEIDELDKNGNVYLANSFLEAANSYLPNSHICIQKPMTLESEWPFDGVLHGRIRQLNPSQTDFIYGFCISEEKEMKSTDIQGGIRFDQCEYDPNSHIVSFNIVLKDFEKYKNGKYYYCSYIFDGENYCFGDVESFEIEWRLSCPNNNHPHVIDLGLPSGTKWACCNVGANSPEGKGGKYAWGETKEKSEYSFATYEHKYDIWHEDLYWHETGYINIGSDIGSTIYDCATINWGTPWRMPTEDEAGELLFSCRSKWVSLNGVSGYLFMGPNYGTIFLPDDSYWTSTFHYKSFAYCFYALNTYTAYREEGKKVRPVYR